MANLLSQNPVIVGAPMASSYKSSVAATLGTLFTLRIEKVVWENAVTQGNFLRIIDPQSGLSLIEQYNEAANQTYTWDWTANPRLWSDFTINQIDSGLCRIYLR